MHGSSHMSQQAIRFIFARLDLNPSEDALVHQQQPSLACPSHCAAQRAIPAHLIRMAHDGHVQIQGEPPKTWTVWSCTSDASKSEGAASGPVDGAASGARAAGHDPVLIDSTPNTPPSNADADVPLAVGLNHSAAVEESRASAGAGAWEPGPTVNRPLLVPNFKLALQVPQPTSFGDLSSAYRSHLCPTRASECPLLLSELQHDHTNLCDPRF